MFRKLFKLFGMLFIAGFIVNVVLVGVFLISILHSSIDSADISFKELLFNDVSSEKIAALNESINTNAANLGTQSGQKLMSFIDNIIPEPDLSLGSLENVEYPYPSSGDILEQINSKVVESQSQGLDMLEKSIPENDSIRNSVIPD